MHTLLLGTLLTVTPPPPAALATIITPLDALKELGRQTEKLVRSGGFDLTSQALSLPRELELAARAQRR
jgi:hypothetical protein